MKKLTVDVLKEMVRKALVSEQSASPSPFPQPANPVQSPPKPAANANLLAQAQKSLADNEALRSEIKAEMEANPQDARLLKMALQDVAQAILANKEVIATLAKKQTGGQVVEEGYDEETGKVEELWLTIENDGQVSDPDQRASNRLGRKYDAVLSNLKKHAVKGRYDRTAAIKGWMYFVDDYAQQYAADYLDSPEGKWLSKSERLEIASRLEEKERNNITGEGEWEKPGSSDFSSDVTFEEQAGAAPALAVESDGYRYNTIDQFLSDYAMGGSYHPDQVSPEVKSFCKKYNFDIPKMIAAAKQMKDPERLTADDWQSDITYEQAYAAPSIAREQSDTFLPDIAEPEEYEHPLDRVRSQEAEFDLSNLGPDEYSGLGDDIPRLDDQDMEAYGDESHWDDVLPDETSGPGWTLSPDPDQSDLPTTYPEDGEDTSWVNDTVPEPGQELPKQMGMGKAGKLRQESGDDGWGTPEDLEVPEESGPSWGVPEPKPPFSMKAHVNDPATIAEKVMEALGWVSNDDPNKVATFEHWVRREAREASRRGGLMDDAQYQEIAEEFISDMTDENEEYSMMDTADQEAAGMTRVEAYPFTLMDKVALGKAIVEKLT